MAEETRAALPFTLSTEPITLSPESAGEMMVASIISSVLVTADLRVITNPTSLTLIIELALSGVVTNPTSLVAGVLVSMKTSPLLLAIPHPSLTSVSATSFTIMN